MAGRVSARSEGPQAPHKARSQRATQANSWSDAAAKWCAFYSTSDPGLRCPWRFGNLNDGSNCGIPCANGNNSPGNSNWNGVPRHADEKPPAKRGHKRCIAPAPCRVLISCDTDTAQLTRHERYGWDGESVAAGFRPAWRLVIESGLPCCKGQGRNRTPLNISKIGGPTLAHKTL
nr:MAG TPA: hypothetical protein [Caudoviricetes sp.]